MPNAILPDDIEMKNIDVTSICTKELSTYVQVNNFIFFLLKQKRAPVFQSHTGFTTETSPSSAT